MATPRIPLVRNGVPPPVHKDLEGRRTYLLSSLKTGKTLANMQSIVEFVGDRFRLPPNLHTTASVQTRVAYEGALFQLLEILRAQIMSPARLNLALYIMSVTKQVETYNSQTLFNEALHLYETAEQAITARQNGGSCQMYYATNDDIIGKMIDDSVKLLAVPAECITKLNANNYRVRKLVEERYGVDTFVIDSKYSEQFSCHRAVLHSNGNRSPVGHMLIFVDTTVKDLPNPDRPDRILLVKERFLKAKEYVLKLAHDSLGEAIDANHHHHGHHGRGRGMPRSPIAAPAVSPPSASPGLSPISRSSSRTNMFDRRDVLQVYPIINLSDIVWNATRSPSFVQGQRVFDVESFFRLFDVARIPQIMNRPDQTIQVNPGCVIIEGANEGPHDVDNPKDGKTSDDARLLEQAVLDFADQSWERPIIVHNSRSAGGVVASRIRQTVRQIANGLPRDARMDNHCILICSSEYVNEGEQLPLEGSIFDEVQDALLRGFIVCWMTWAHTISERELGLCSRFRSRLQILRLDEVHAKLMVLFRSGPAVSAPLPLSEIHRYHETPSRVQHHSQNVGPTQATAAGRRSAARNARSQSNKGREAHVGIAGVPLAAGAGKQAKSFTGPSSMPPHGMLPFAGVVVNSDKGPATAPIPIPRTQTLPVHLPHGSYVEYQQFRQTSTSAPGPMTGIATSYGYVSDGHAGIAESFASLQIEGDKSLDYLPPSVASATRQYNSRKSAHFATKLQSRGGNIRQSPVSKRQDSTVTSEGAGRTVSEDIVDEIEVDLELELEVVDRDEGSNGSADEEETDGVPSGAHTDNEEGYDIDNEETEDSLRGRPIVSRNGETSLKEEIPRNIADIWSSESTVAMNRGAEGRSVDSGGPFRSGEVFEGISDKRRVRVHSTSSVSLPNLGGNLWSPASSPPANSFGMNWLGEPFQAKHSRQRGDR